tara:strand:+ start:23037 stop:24920 length:1884 start_codon:yes stop_codon:yes gene_type:complete
MVWFLLCRLYSERNTMKNFDGLGLNSVLQDSLARMKYTVPTPIQAQAIPVALDGRDILGSAQTGTGKTAAFAIPLVEALLNDERKCALVMTPTRELGKQVMEIMQQLLGPKSNIKTAFLIGGESMNKQYAQLKRRPRLVVGTPGRINDHLERRNLHLDQTRFLVLDETDRMLDMGFSIQIDRIVKHIPDDRQTLLFSATMPKNIIKMADKYQHNPERIAIGSSINVAENIDQKVVRVDQDKKYEVLTDELDVRGGSVIVFVKTKRGADKLARKLQDHDYKADAIHGDLKQSKRDRVIKAYRGKAFRILVATDVVARGLDVPHVEHVINYDLPQVPEDYIHRIGRTARAGAKGESLCLITPQDGRKWHAIEQMLFPDKHPGKPANDERSRNSSKRKRPHRGQADGNKFGAKRRDDRNDDRQGRSDRPAYKGKRSFGDRNEDGAPQKKRNFRDGKPGENRSEGRNFSKDRSENGERSNEGRPYKGKRDFSENKGSDSRRSNEGRKFSKDRSENGERSNEGQSYKAKRSFSENKKSDSRRSNEGRTFSKDRSEGGEEKFVGNQTRRSRSFSDKQKPAGGGKPQSRSGNGSNRKFSGGNPAAKNDGNQTRSRSGGKNKFSGPSKGKDSRAA